MARASPSRSSQGDTMLRSQWIYRLSLLAALMLAAGAGLKW
jgi:hypothetical protein